MSITQAAAAIIGTFIGSSLLTVLVVILILRYRRKRRNDNRNREREWNRGMTAGGVEKFSGRRPESYNSMEANMTRGDVTEKEPPMFSPESDTTKVGGVSRIGTSTSRMAEGYGGGDNNGYNSQGTRGEGGDIARKPTGEAITVNYARSIKYSDRKPVKLSDPPPAKPKKSSTTTANISSEDEDNNVNENNTTPGDSGKWNLFPKVDPSPKRSSRSLVNPFGRQQQPTPRAVTTTTDAAQTQQPGAEAPGRPPTVVNLQAWLQTASVSPFGPLGDENNTNGPSAAVNGGRGAGAGLPARVRLSEVKWPLQDSGNGPTRSDSTSTVAGGAAGGTSFSTRMVGTGQGVRNPFSSGGEGAVVKNNEAARVVPRPNIGLPGPVRKLPLRDR